MNRRAFIALSALAPLAPRDLAPDFWDPFQRLNTALDPPYWGVDQGAPGRDVSVYQVYSPPSLKCLGTFERAEGETDEQLLDRIVRSLGT